MVGCATLVSSSRRVRLNLARIAQVVDVLDGSNRARLVPRGIIGILCTPLGVFWGVFADVEDVLMPEAWIGSVSLPAYNGILLALFRTACGANSVLDYRTPVIPW
jgi:hypothetical protein